MQCDDDRGNGRPYTPADSRGIADDPTRPGDPTWAAWIRALKVQGLCWEDLGAWELGPTPESLDVTPMFLVGAATAATPTD